jgi:hypothetical protein
MKTTLLGFGIGYLAGAVLLVFNIYFDLTPTLPMKSLAVLAFFLPGVVALIAHLEIVRLKKQLNDILGRGKERESDIN